MEQNIFIQMTKLHNAKGRISYITSTAKQENLYAIYETTERWFWSKLVKENRDTFKKSGTEGECIEARELIIALPKSFVQYEPNELLREYTEFFKSKSGVECISALHHNKRKTNYHIHLIFSERKLLEEPIRKVASRNMFYDESGKKVRTKKEILDVDGSIRHGCKVIKKGEVYEEHLFDKKEARFKQKSFLDEVKEAYAEKMNERMKDSGLQMRVFPKDSPFLPTKKIGKNNPKAKFIRENNAERLRWNRSVSKALSYRVPAEILVAVKKNEVSKPIIAAVKDYGTATDMVIRIIDRAVGTLNRFVKRYLYEKLAEIVKPENEAFFRLLDETRGRLKKNINRDRDAR